MHLSVDPVGLAEGCAARVRPDLTLDHVHSGERSGAETTWQMLLGLRDAIVARLPGQAGEHAFSNHRARVGRRCGSCECNREGMRTPSRAPSRPGPCTVTHPCQLAARHPRPAGAVLLTGTDAMAETAFVLSLLVHSFLAGGPLCWWGVGGEGEERNGVDQLHQCARHARRLGPPAPLLAERLLLRGWSGGTLQAWGGRWC